MAAPRVPQDRKRSTKRRREATSADAWRKGGLEPLEVPSGNVCLARAVGMQAFIKAGLVPNSLMPMVQQALKGKKGDVSAAEILDEIDVTPESLAELMEMTDAVVIFSVVRPKVFAVPKDASGVVVPFENREEIDGLWVDEVDEEDKDFIFQFATGGTRDIESFRQEFARQLESLPNRQDLEMPAQ